MTSPVLLCTERSLLLSDSTATTCVTHPTSSPRPTHLITLSPLSQLITFLQRHLLTRDTLPATMPIPPRPIPTNRTSRPGTSVPRKSPLAFDKSDWRSELTYISDRPRSLPAQNGVMMVEKAKFDRATKRDEVGEVLGKREVAVEGLIVDGKGWREKRGMLQLTRY
jgi:hypothetical protein